MAQHAQLVGEIAHATNQLDAGDRLGPIACAARAPLGLRRLTDKGADLIPALLALMQWGDRWAWPGGRGPVRVTHDECGHDVRVEVRCPHCERELATAQLRASARGGVVEPPKQHSPGAVSGRRLLGGSNGVALDGRRDGADALP